MANNTELVDDLYTKDGTVDYKGHPANKHKTGTWKACPYILGTECSQTLAYSGMCSNLVLYLKHQLNQTSATAAKNQSNWSGACFTTPLLGAFLADAYLGRYWTIAIFSIIYFIGMILLTLSAGVPGLKPTCHGGKDMNCHATSSQSAVCFVALYMIALGTGGIKPCVSSYGADQFDDADQGEKKHKSSFFNWFYFSINVGAMIAISVLVYVQENVGWGWGFGIPTMAMAVAVASFFSGTHLYRNQKPGGSPLTRISQVLVACFRKWRVQIPQDKSLLYETADAEQSVITGSRKLDHTSDFRFLDKAAVEIPSDSKRDPWRICTVTQVEELKGIIRLLPVWATVIIFAAVYNQMSNFFVLQGELMDTRLGKTSFHIPAASLTIFDTISVIIWVPVYDRIIVPLTRRITGRNTGLTQLQRMGVGLFISIFSMVCSAILELVRLKMVRGNGKPLTIFWQAPQYFLIGCAEVFTFIGQTEFFYQQAPDAMRSLCSALSLSTIALGNYLSSFFITIVIHITATHGNPGWLPDNLNNGRLHYFFSLLAVLSVLNLGAFIFVAKWYTYKTPVGTHPQRLINL